MLATRKKKKHPTRNFCLPSSVNHQKIRSVWDREKRKKKREMKIWKNLVAEKCEELLIAKISEQKSFQYLWDKILMGIRLHASIVI